ncbi:MAG: sigma-70 family RNA polymerase sigma factor [Clostridiales bacterium]|nr:sigma-70 family RNA polymerase sigma factor [Clostridiales bacterium]
MLHDSKIIDLFYERSDDAIVELSKKYGPVCRKVASNILNNNLDVEECVNDAFLGAWNTIPPQKPDPLLTYVCRIVRNLSIKKYHVNTCAKRNSFYDSALDELEECLASTTNVETELAAKELTGLLDSFLDTLNKENRMMFTRRYWYSDSVSDIATGFQLSNNTVTVRLFRIREKLRVYLRKAGFEI